MRRLILLSALPVVLIGLGVFGVSTATSAVLCQANESPCSPEAVIEKDMQFWIFGQMTFGPYSCSVGPSMKVTDVGGEGKVVKADLVALSPECRVGIAGVCSTIVANLPYQVEFSGSGGNGSMTVSDPAEFSMKLQCSPPASQCTFSTKSPIEFSFTGGKPAVVAATNVPMTSGAGCPTSMSAQLKSLLPPQSLFIVEGPALPATRLCKVATSPCPEGSRYAVGATIEGSLEGNSVFEFLYEGKPREPACETGTMTGKTTAAGTPLIGEVSAMSFSKCGGGLCAVEAQSLPYKAEIAKTSGGNGTIAFVSGGSGVPKIEVNCGKSFKCVYKATSISFTLTGGNPAKIAVAKTMEKDAASEAECGSTMTWKATYKLTKPTPLFVT